MTVEELVERLHAEITERQAALDAIRKAAGLPGTLAVLNAARGGMLRGKTGKAKAKAARPTSGPRAAKRAALVERARPMLAKEPALSVNALAKRLGIKGWALASYVHGQAKHAA